MKFIKSLSSAAAVVVDKGAQAIATTASVANESLLMAEDEVLAARALNLLEIEASLQGVDLEQAWAVGNKLRRA